MQTKWESTSLYEHPVKYQAGTSGKIALSAAGVYALRVGASLMSCPQDWAAKIHAGETSRKIVTIRGIDPDLWRQFRVRCLERGVRVSDGLNALLAESLRPGQGGR